MKQPSTETEDRVIDILVNHETTPDPYAAPIHAIDRAMNWHNTAKTEEFVRDLQLRDLVRMVPVAGDGIVWDPKTRWEKCDALV